MARTKTCQPRYFTTTVAQISLCLLFTFAITQALGQSTFDVTDSMEVSIFHVKDDGTIGIGTDDPKAQIHILGTGTVDTPNISGGIPLVVQRSGNDFTRRESPSYLARTPVPPSTLAIPTTTTSGKSSTIMTTIQCDSKSTMAFG